MVQQILQKETTNSENPLLRREKPVRSEDLSGEPQGESGAPQPTESKDDAEARRDFWSIQGEFTYRHHTEPRVQLYVPKEETFPVPQKYMKCYEVYSHRFGCDAGETHEIQTTTRQDYVWPEVLTKIGKAAQNREKQRWAKEEPKLDDARKLRGIYFIDADDREY